MHLVIFWDQDLHTILNNTEWKMLKVLSAKSICRMNLTNP